MPQTTATIATVHFGTIAVLGLLLPLVPVRAQSQGDVVKETRNDNSPLARSPGSDKVSMASGLLRDAPLIQRPLGLANSASRLPQNSSGFSETPIIFEENIGQSYPDVRFISRVNQQTVLFRSSGVTFISEQGHIQLNFPGSSMTVAVEGKSLLPTKMNYIFGSDSHQWFRNIRNYESIQYKDLYPGIDLIFHSRSKALEYDIIVHPGARLDSVTLTYTGAETIDLERDGQISVRSTTFGLHQLSPVAYQLNSGTSQPIKCSYIDKGNGVFSITAGDFDPTEDLVVDPVLLFSSHIGSSATVPRGTQTGLATSTGEIRQYERSLSAFTVAASGNTYIARGALLEGLTIPIAQIGAAANVLLICKMSPTGDDVLFCTATGSRQSVTALALDSSQNIYIGGVASGGELITTPGVFQPAAKTFLNGYVQKFSANGDALIYSSYLGGSNINNYVNGIAVTASGSAVLVGYTGSSDFPLKNPLLSARTAGGFVTRVNPSGSALEFSTYLSGTDGSSDDVAHAVTLDSSGNAYVTGGTYSSDFPLTAGMAHQGFSGIHAFIAKLSPTGQLQYSYVVAQSTDSDRTGFQPRSYGLGISTDAAGAAYITGMTSATDLPVSPLAPQKSNKGTGYDAFVMKLVPAGTAIQYLTYLGSSGFDEGLGIVAESTGSVYVTGHSQCWDMPMASPLYPPAQSGLNGAFFIKDSNGSYVRTTTGAAERIMTIASNSQNASVAYAVASSNPWILKSTDGGTSWFALPLPFTIPNEPGTSRGLQNVILDPADQNIVWLSVNMTALALEVWRSTDAGNSWAKFSSLGSILLKGIKKAPSNASIRVAYGWRASGDSISKSVDGGSTWSSISAAASGIRCDGSRPCTVYDLRIDSTNPNNLTAATGGGVFRTIDGGINWSLLGEIYPAIGSINTSNVIFGTQSVNEVWAGGWYGVRKSVDGGVTWTTVRSGNGIFPTIAVHPLGSSVYARTPYSLAETTDGGATWTVLDDSGNLGSGPMAPDASTPRKFILGDRSPQHAFLTKLSPNGATLSFSTCFGGSSHDIATGIGLDSANNIYIGGETMSLDLPTTSGAFQRGFGGSGAWFVARFADGYPPAVTVSVSPTAVTLGPSQTRQFSSTVVGGSRGVTWTVSPRLGSMSVFGIYTAPSSIEVIQTVTVRATSIDDPSKSSSSSVTLTPPATQPQIGSISPPSGGGMTQTFTMTGIHTGGANNLTSVSTLINTLLNGSGSCWVTVNLLNNTATLANDAGSGQASGVLTPGTGAISNSQCSISGVGFTVAKSGNSATVTLPIAFNGGFAGAKNVYQRLVDNTNKVADWTAIGTWTVGGVTGDPQIGSILPSSGGGMSQTFTVTGNHTGGANSLTSVSTLINAVLNGSGACWVTVNLLNNTATLTNDAGSGQAGGAIAPGAGAISNSQCSISGIGFTVTRVGNSATVTLPIVFSGSFAGTKTVYQRLVDNTNKVAGWTAIGTWTVGGVTGDPQIGSTSPPGGAGMSQTFTVTGNHTGGANNLTSISTLINAVLNGSGSCWVTVNLLNNTATLANDAGSGQASGVIAPGTGASSNSQCSISGVGFTVAKSGNSATVTLPIVFSGAFVGAKSVYQRLVDNTNKVAGWAGIGTWTVGGVIGGPQIGGISPSSGSGMSQTFTVTGNHTGGANNLTSVSTLINAVLNGSGSCWVTVNLLNNTATLTNDAGSNHVSGAISSGTGTISNSQCSISGVGFTVTKSGNSATVTLPIVFSSGFAGAKNVYQRLVDNTAKVAEWTAIGTWTIP